jgi:hypothetical protein
MSIPVHRSTRSRRALVLFALVAVSACRSTQTGTAADQAVYEPSTIEFRNESLKQADVFVVSSGSGARRIGTVFAGRTESLEIPRDIATRGNINVVARLLASSRAPSTGSLAIGPGTHLSVRLPMDEKSLYVLPAQ